MTLVSGEKMYRYNQVKKTFQVYDFSSHKWHNVTVTGFIDWYKIQNKPQAWYPRNIKESGFTVTIPSNVWDRLKKNGILLPGMED